VLEADPAIGLVHDSYQVELEYRSVGRSLSGWGPKREPSAPIVVGSEVVDFLRQKHSCSCSFGLL
jgi:hypothetical protein